MGRWSKLVQNERTKEPTHAETELLDTSKRTNLQSTNSAVWDAALADAWIADALKRISPRCAALGDDGPEWESHETMVSAAYQLRNMVALREALAAYEALADTLACRLCGRPWSVHPDPWGICQGRPRP